MTMRLRNSFHLPVALPAAGNLFAALVLALALAAAIISSPSKASTIPAASSGAYEQAAMGEIEPRRTAEPRAPDRPAECFEVRHSCGPSALLPSHAGPLSLDLARHVSSVAPRAPERVSVPGMAPHLAASLSILFRNFRK